MAVKDSYQKQIETIRRKIHFYSSSGDQEETARLFVRAVENHIIPLSRDPLQWCFKTLGRDNTEHVLKALAAWSCPVCKKGFEQCDLCDGSGWSGPDMLCETCMGLGVVPCQFCGGSGLSNLESMPAGLRLTVLGIRGRLTAKHITVIQSKLNGRGPEPDAADLTVKPQETLLILSGLLSRLEGCLDEIKQMGPIHRRHRFLLGKIKSDCANGGIFCKRLITQVLQDMIKAEESRMNDPQASETAQRLCRIRAEFYHEILDSELEWSGTWLQHPLLARAIQRIESSAQWKKAGKRRGNSFRSGGKPKAAA